MGFCGNGLRSMHGSGWGTLGGILGILFFLGVMLVLVVAAVWLFRRLSRQSQSPRASEDALEIARRRLAAGEITIADFEEIRETLRR